MLFEGLFIIIGFVLLIVGADILVKGSSNIAKKFHIPEMVIGLTIVAIGTSFPELIITLTSASKGYTDLIIGNAIGSNLCNLLLILGLISVIRPVVMDKETRDLHLPIAIFATILVLLLGNGMLGTQKFVINQFEGTILLIMAILYFIRPIYIAIKDVIQSEKEEKEHPPQNKISVVKALLFIVVGIIMLKYGADFVVDSATSIAEAFGISERIIGLTVIAIGTALPELITSIVATIKGDEDMAIGNLIGSCVLNLWMVIGLGAVIKPLGYSTEFNINLMFLAWSTTLIWLYNFIGRKHTITRPKGIILMCLFVVYIVRLFI